MFTVFSLPGPKSNQKNNWENIPVVFSFAQRGTRCTTTSSGRSRSRRPPGCWPRCTPRWARRNWQPISVSRWFASLRDTRVLGQYLNCWRQKQTKKLQVIFTKKKNWKQKQSLLCLRCWLKTLGLLFFHFHRYFLKDLNCCLEYFLFYRESCFCNHALCHFGF